MCDDVVVRLAVPSEHKELEALQVRASLNNPGDREALLANPEVIALPMDQIRDGRVFVAEIAKSIKGFAAILPRDDGDFEPDALFVGPDAWRRGLGKALLQHCVDVAGPEARTRSMSSVILTPKLSMEHAGSSAWEP